MKANGQCKFVMGAMLGFMWCVWAVVHEEDPYRMLAKFFVGLWAIIIAAIIDQSIELRRGIRK